MEIYMKYMIRLSIFTRLIIWKALQFNPAADHADVSSDTCQTSLTRGDNIVEIYLPCWRYCIRETLSLYRLSITQIRLHYM